MPSTRLYGPSAVPGSAGALALNTSGASAPVLPAVQTVASSTAETMVTNPSVPGTALVTSIPANSPVEGKQFIVLASGLLNNGTSSTVTLKLYSGTSTTPGSNTSLGSSGAVTAFAGKSNWFVEARLIYDTASGKLNGTIKFMINNVLVAEAAVANVVTGIVNSSLGAAAINFALSVTFGTGGTQVITVNALDVNF